MNLDIHQKKFNDLCLYFEAVFSGTLRLIQWTALIKTEKKKFIIKLQLSNNVFLHQRHLQFLLTETITLKS